MSGLKAAFLNAATRLTGASARDKALEREVLSFLQANAVAALSLESIEGEEPRRIFYGGAKFENRTVAFIVSTDATLGVLGGALVQPMTGSQFKLMRFEWEHSIASCVRFYDFLLDRLAVYARMEPNAGTDRI